MVRTGCVLKNQPAKKEFALYFAAGNGQRQENLRNPCTRNCFYIEIGKPNWPVTGILFQLQKKFYQFAHFVPLGKYSVSM